MCVGGGSARLAPAPADDRGITLQTLIITAVVVLLAVAAGVVIVAVTGSSSDDLEESAAEVEGNCDPVEIYDPEVAARNEKGTQVAYTNFASPRDGNTAPNTQVELVEFEGSDIGCVPVCLWTEPVREGITKNRILQAGEVLFVRDLSQRRDLIINVEKPVLVGEARIYLLASGSPSEEISYFAKEGAEVGVEFVHDENVEPRGYVQYTGTGSNAFVDRNVAKVAVAPNGNECLTYDEYGNVLFHR